VILKISSVFSAFSHLLYPSLCFGCGDNEIGEHEFICIRCLSALPYTQFEKTRNNPIEKLFWGRTHIKFACSTFYYVEQTPLQQLIHQVKYKEQQKLGIYLGTAMGNLLNPVFNENEVDLLIPMPLHPKKLKKRGYNQASLLCDGISTITGRKYDEEVLVRTENTSTQTKKSRLERWGNVHTVFSVNDSNKIRDKHILLVDDVITTGASTEACAQTLLNAGSKSVAICSLAFTL
jgi:ComF family protein